MIRVDMTQPWMIELTFLVLHAFIGAAHHPQRLPPA
jgi:hypothetical protein